MSKGLFISKCNFLSSILKDNHEESEINTIIQYSTNMLRNMKQELDSCSNLEDCEEMNLYYQMVFSDFMEFQVKRVERVV